MSAKKKHFTFNCIHLHKACQILSTFTNQCQCIFTVSVFIILTLNPNIPILSTAIPQHTTISLIHCTGYKALL
jgi:flavin reductase (DIM6/NTAB) family NADH-FMN oxidoreductase RutF